MEQAKIRRAFLGGNTGQGFYSYYDCVLPRDEASKIFIIKGGSGVGKSTFMKKIGEKLLEKGFDLEYMHCSSDSDSIDGLVIPKLKIALLDGTLPHAVEPKYPGVIDEIIDLGRFLNVQEIESKRTQIINESKEKSRLFTRAYKYLQASSLIYQDIYEINSRCANLEKVNLIAIEIIEEIFEKDEEIPAEGRERKLFASAITPSGLINHLDTILVTDRVYGVKGEPGLGSERLLVKIKDAAVKRGFYTECFFCALSPQKLEHLVIPEKNISFTTINKYHTAEVSIDKLIDIDDYRDNDILEKDKSIIEYNTYIFEQLLYRAISTIKDAKKSHGILESYYISSMDFNNLQIYREDIMSRILEHAECYKNSF